jgi:hypothetical protein
LGSTSYRSVYKTVALYGEGHGTTEDFCYWIYGYLFLIST